MTDDAFDIDAYVSEFQAKHEERNDFFGSHPQSPIPPEERDSFDDLDYFDSNPDYRVTASIKTHADPEPVTADTLTDSEIRYLRVATFHSELRDTDLTFGTYRQEHGNSPMLFVPFHDKTTGQQTYSDDRYMELTPDTPFDELKRVVVDFSLAYNPFCAFTRAFERPLPPEENWLDVIIPADEQDYE